MGGCQRLIEMYSETGITLSFDQHWGINNVNEHQDFKIPRPSQSHSQVTFFCSKTTHSAAPCRWDAEANGPEWVVPLAFWTRHWPPARSALPPPLALVE